MNKDEIYKQVGKACKTHDRWMTEMDKLGSLLSENSGVEGLDFFCQMLEGDGLLVTPIDNSFDDWSVDETQVIPFAELLELLPLDSVDDIEGLGI